MDDSKLEKIKLWGNIVMAAICYFMFIYLFCVSMSKPHNVLGAILFLVIASNCTYRIRAHYKIERMRKSAFSEKEVAKAVRRQGIVSSIFSNATAGFYMLLMTVFFLFTHLKDKYIVSAICGVIALCFITLLVLSIRNLKRYDRL